MATTFERRTVYLRNFWKVFTFTVGVFADSKYHFYEILHTVFMVIISLISILGYLIGKTLNNSRSTVKSYVVNLISIALIFFILQQYWTTKRYKKLIFNFVNNLIFECPDFIGSEATIQTEKLFRTMLLKLMVTYSILLSATVVSIFTFLFGDVNYENEFNYILPFWYWCSSMQSINTTSTAAPIVYVSAAAAVDTIESPTLRFFCFKIDSYEKYVLINTVQLVALSQQVFMNATVIVFYIIVTQCIEAHTSYLQREISRFSYTRINNQLVTDECTDNSVRIILVENESNSFNIDESLPLPQSHSIPNIRADNITSRNDDIDAPVIPASHFQLRGEFRKLIRYYQFLYRSIREMSPFLDTIVATNTVHMFIFLVSSSFFVIYGKTDFDDIQFKVGFMTIASLMQYLYYCYAAETFRKLNESIAHFVYCTPWYKFPADVQKTVLQFLILLNKPIEIRCFKVYTIGLNFLTKILRFTYSSLQFIFALIK